MDEFNGREGRGTVSENLKIGSLFSGGGMLDFAVEYLFGAETVWHCEFDKHASKVLSHHWPDVPNFGDITQVDWSQVEPVDILLGGSPCQDLSVAGRKAGMTEGTRSNLWVNMREAIDTLRPELVIWENVKGARSARATSESDLESEDGSVGKKNLRALGRVLGDLTEIGYDATWTTLRASDVGAPHHRERVFLIATPSDARGFSFGQHAGESPAEKAGSEAGDRPGDHRGVRSAGDGRQAASASADPQGLGRSHDGLTGGGSSSESSTDLGEHVLPDESSPVKHLPTLQARDWKGPPAKGYNVGNLPTTVEDFLPTPTASDGSGGGQHPDRRTGHTRQLIDHALAIETDFGQYETVIRRWERVLGVPVPPPTDLNRNGRPRLNAAFAEWMMGLPSGWITDLGLPRSAELKILGNGVVPAQAYAAISSLLPRLEDS